MESLQQAIALLAVFAALGAALWFARNKRNPFLNISAGRGERRMQVLERIALTPTHTLCLVKVDRRVIMIGTSPSSCQTIRTIEEVQ